MSSKRIRKNGLPLILFCTGAFLVIQSLSSGSAKVSAPLKPLEQPQAVEADGYCMLAPVSPDQRIAASGLIVEGDVIAQKSFWDSRHQNIYTANLVNVYKVFKGRVSGGQIEVITEGGTVGDQKQVTTPALELSTGEMGVFFCESSKIVDPLKRTSAPGYMAYGSPQGFIRYRLSDGTASEPFKNYTGIESDVYNSIRAITGAAPREVAENKRLAGSHKAGGGLFPNVVPTISSFTPTTITAGTDQVVTITGTGFGVVQGTGFVEFKNSNDGGATLMTPLASDYTSWTDTEIKVMVPSGGASLVGCAGTGTIKVTNSDPASVTSAGSLTIEYGYTNVGDDGTDGVGGGIVFASQMPDHVNDNTLGGYTFALESGEFTPVAAAVTAFTSAMNTWTCATGMNWLVGAPTVVDTIAADGVNVVRFDDGAELPVGVLGRATSRYAGCAVALGYFTWEVSEIDVAFDDATTWEFGPALPSAGEIDFESVAVHELGHGHQLQHVIAPGAVMHFSISSGTSARALGASDKAGGRYVMTRSEVANVCGTGPMIKAIGVACGPTAANADISGQILDVAGQPVAGVVLTLSGMEPAQTITDSRGRYSFEGLESGAFYSVTPWRANYLFSPMVRSFSLLGNHADAAFTAAGTGIELANPLDTDLFFVRQQYLDFLGREPDSGGLAYWSDELKRCGTDTACLNSRRIGVAGAFFVEPEFQRTGSFIYGLYKGALGRGPLYREYSADRPRVIAGTDLEAVQQSFAESFVQRPEFLAKYQGETSAESFVDALIQNVQEHSGISLRAQRTELIRRYNAGANRNEGRSRALRGLIESRAFQQAEYNQVFVLMEYFGYLKRDPEPEGYAFWLNVLDDRDPGNYRGMVCSFITSAEYQKRFSAVVTHSNAECGK
ncbi:MAG: matrixin family metalloprotease [Pyrinomonadaceae bacterium]